MLLAVIGPNWLEAASGHGRRRLDDPDDFVRIEILAALQREVLVVPVLIDNTQMPLHGDLPEALRPLSRLNAITVSHARFSSDIKKLVQDLELPRRR